MRLSCEEVRELAAGYVLDALEPREQIAVREHLQTCPQAHAEFNELGGVVGYLSDAVEPIEPPPALKERVLAAAAADAVRAESGQAESGRAEPGTEASASRATRATRAGERRRERPWQLRLRAHDVPPAARSYRPSPLAWIAGVAAAVFIFALGGLAFLLQGELQAARQYEQAVAAVLDLAADPGGQLAVLTGDAGGGPRGLAAISPNGRVVIAMRGLTATTGNEVYEAWLIAGDNPPVPMGGFEVGGQGTGTLVTDAAVPAQEVVLAITREPAPGATTPTLPIVASGAATDPSS